MSKKIFSLILISAILIANLLFFSSCSSPYSEEQAREILADVLERETRLCQIIYGKGFDTREDPGDHVNDSTFYYMEVAPNSEYVGLDELKEAVKETYAEDIRKVVWEYAFGSEDKSDEATFIPRYAENDGYLQIDVTNGGFDLKSVAYIGESRIARGRKNMIEIEIKVSSDGGETFREKTLILKNEDGIWKLDTQSWCVGMRF